MTKTPVRRRLSVTVTVDQGTIKMLEHFAAKLDNNRSEAVTRVVGRYAYLLTTADLSGVSSSQFRALCQYMSGSPNSPNIVDAQHALRTTVQFAIVERDEASDQMRTMKFANETDEQRAAFETRFNDELTRLNGLLELVNGLDRQQCTALFERIQDVIGSGSDDDFEARCATVFDKIAMRVL